MLDDPLWDKGKLEAIARRFVLIPLLLDDPLWVLTEGEYELYLIVLIPLLLDDPLWASSLKSIKKL